MARTAKPKPEHLSQYLTGVAEPFSIYPDRDYRDRKVRGVFTRWTRRFVEWQKTFQPPDKEPLREVFEHPKLLDQFYSRELLAAVPEVVARTRDLKALTFAGIADADALAYLREAATCYIHGLFQGTAALSRSAIERSLRARAVTVFPKAAVEEAELRVLIDRLSAGALSRQVIAQAHRVRVGGNEVLHAGPADQARALALLEDARAVVLAASARK